MIEILVYAAAEVNEKVKKLEDVIEQLEKENEWLLNRSTENYRYGYGQIRVKELKEEMQQALKEK